MFLFDNLLKRICVVSLQLSEAPNKYGIATFNTKKMDKYGNIALTFIRKNNKKHMELCKIKASVCPWGIKVIFVT